MKYEIAAARALQNLEFENFERLNAGNVFRILKARRKTGQQSNVEIAVQRQAMQLTLQAQSRTSGKQPNNFN